MIFDCLPSEVILHIALFDDLAWYRLWQYCPHFRNKHPEIGPIYAQTFVERITGRTYLFGKLNSIDDEPAVIHSDGQRDWYRNGKHYRNGGPAIIYPNGRRDWYQNDKRHRTDGPAIIYADGRQDWYQNNKRHRLSGPAVVCANGQLLWYNFDKQHRTNGPAVICPDGQQFWYKNGKLINQPM